MYLNCGSRSLEVFTFFRLALALVKIGPKLVHVVFEQPLGWGNGSTLLSSFIILRINFYYYVKYYGSTLQNQEIVTEVMTWKVLSICIHHFICHFFWLEIIGKQERKGFRSMIARSQFSNLQLGNLATWQFGNLAFWQLGNLATWQFGNLAT